MTKQQYERISAPFKNRSLFVLRILNQGISALTFISFPVLLFLLYRTQSLKKAIAYAICAGITFVFVSLFRKMVNRKRPYEALDIVPLIKKEKTGHSFPSRHVFSVFLISILWFCVSPAIGACLFIGGIILAFIRVVGGIHFTSDVICGAAIGVLLGILIIHIANLFTF